MKINVTQYNTHPTGRSLSLMACLQCACMEKVNCQTWQDETTLDTHG